MPRLWKVGADTSGTSSIGHRLLLACRYENEHRFVPVVDAAGFGVATKANGPLFWRAAEASTNHNCERRGPESNRRIAVLQTAALPLGYRAEEP
jgi:hypothetical protein